jgi:hypothetical protein
VACGEQGGSEGSAEESGAAGDEEVHGEKNTEYRRQKTEDRRQKTEDRRQKTEDRRQKTEDRRSSQKK